MVHIDDAARIEPFLKEHELYDRIFKRFDNIFIGGRTTTNVIPNSIYIYNSLGIDARASSQENIVNISFSFRANSSQWGYTGYRCGDVLFTSASNGNTIGEYYSHENILVLIHIDYELNEFAVEVLEKILEWLETNPSIDKSIFTQIKPRDDAYLTIGNTTYTLRAIGGNQNNREQFVDTVVKKSRETIIKLRQQWVEHLEREKARYEKIRKSTRAMPEINYIDVIKQHLSLSKEGTYLIYSFYVKIVVEEVMNENTKVQAKLDEPVVYEGILSFYMDEKDRLVNVRFTKPDGVSHCKHLHADSGNFVCVGTTNLIGKVLKTPDEVIAAKERLIRAMSIINLGSCMSASDTELYNKLRAKLSEVNKPNIEDVWTVS